MLSQVYDVLVYCERVEFGDGLRLRLLLLVMLQVDGVFFLLLVGVRATAAVSKAWVLFRVTATLLQDEREYFVGCCRKFMMFWFAASALSLEIVYD